MPNIRSWARLLLFGSIVAAIQPQAYAGPYADSLSQCFVRSTTDSDRTTLVRWMFSIVALHPDIQSLTTVSDSQRVALNLEVADLMEKLVSESCRAETQEAIKFEGSQAVDASFGILGEIGLRRLLADPHVLDGVVGFTKYLDRSKFEPLIEGTKQQ